MMWRASKIYGQLEMVLKQGLRVQNLRCGPPAHLPRGHPVSSGAALGAQHLAPQCILQCRRGRPRAIVPHLH